MSFGSFVVWGFVTGAFVDGDFVARVLVAGAFVARAFVDGAFVMPSVTIIAIASRNLLFMTLGIYVPTKRSMSGSCLMNRNSIVFNIFRLILNRTEFRFVSY